MAYIRRYSLSGYLKSPGTIQEGDADFRRGEFSVTSDIAFEKHLQKLARNKDTSSVIEPIWYFDKPEILKAEMPKIHRVGSRLVSIPIEVH